MTQRRTRPATPTDRPGTWIALAVAFLAISLPSWVQALGDGKTLGYLPAAAFTLAAVLFAVHARRCARRRAGR